MFGDFSDTSRQVGFKECHTSCVIYCNIKKKNVFKKVLQVVSKLVIKIR